MQRDQDVHDLDHEHDPGSEHVPSPDPVDALVTEPRRVLRAVRDVNLERSRNEAELAQREETEGARFRHDHARSRNDIEGRYNEALRREQVTFEAELARIRLRGDEEIDALEAEYAKRRRRLDEQFEDQSERIRKGWQESRWLTDSVFEAAEPQPQAWLDKLRSELSAARSRLAAAHQQSVNLLDRYRQSIPEVTFGHVLVPPHVQDRGTLETENVSLETPSDAPPASSEGAPRRETVNTTSTSTTPEWSQEHQPHAATPVTPQGPVDTSPGDGSAPAWARGRLLAAWTAAADTVRQRTAEAGSVDGAKASLDACADEAEALVAQLAAVRSGRLFAGAAIGFIALIIFAACIAGAAAMAGWSTPTGYIVGAVTGAAAAALVVLGLHRLARRTTYALYVAIAGNAAAGEVAARQVDALAVLKRNRWRGRLVAERDRDHESAKRKHEGLLQTLTTRVNEERSRIEHEYPERIARRRTEQDERLAHLQDEHERTRNELEQNRVRDLDAIDRQIEIALTELHQSVEADWTTLSKRWTQVWHDVQAMSTAAHAARQHHFPAWNTPSWRTWTPPHAFEPVSPFGRLEFDLAAVEGGVPSDERLLAVSEYFRFEIPAAVRFPEQASLFIDSGPRGRNVAIQAIQNYMMRLLTSMPPGKVRFLILDPVGLGRNFAGFMHLADHDEALVGGRIWTEARHIEQRLLDLTEHMEHVIQKYLRNEFESITAYNERAGAVAEPYRFLVVSDFPVNFSESSVRRLTSLATSGPRCGVHLIILRDIRQPLPTGTSLEDLRSRAQYITERRPQANAAPSTSHAAREADPRTGNRSRSNAGDGSASSSSPAGTGRNRMFAAPEQRPSTGTGSIFDADLLAVARPAATSESTPHACGADGRTTALSTMRFPGGPDTPTEIDLESVCFGAEAGRTPGSRPSAVRSAASSAPSPLTTTATTHADGEHESGPPAPGDTASIDTAQQGTTASTMVDAPSSMAADGDDRVEFVWRDSDVADLRLSFEDPPTEELSTAILHRIGEAARDATRVEVAFSTIAPDPQRGEMWSRTCDRELSIPLGRAGATRLQSIMLGRGTNQHVLIAGKTGSGKSTLLHVLITNLALWYAPHEVDFYLVDFKKGVEFKTYGTHQLPHARAIAVESDREFGVSVLQRVDQELKRRGELFRELGVQDLAGYRARRNADDPQHPRLPRTLLIIDEFQEFFTEDDRIAQEAALLLDRLVRQGRAFGIHVILGSQTLSGAYTLARSTMGQMGVRVALQCSETDSYLIFNEDNSAARLLSRPGEAIYNDAAGNVEGNSPFQICWLPEQERSDRLEAVRQAAADGGFEREEPLVVFEGNVLPRPSGNRALQRFIDTPAWTQSRPGIRTPAVWLGEPVAIRPPVEVRFERRGGSHLMIVGQQEETAEATLTIALLALLSQVGPTRQDGDSTDAVHPFTVLDVAGPGGTAQSEQSEDSGSSLGWLARQFPHAVDLAPWGAIGDRMAAVARLVERRTQQHAAHVGSDAGTTVDHPLFILVNGLHRFRMLRSQEDDFGFSTSFSSGPSGGFGAGDDADASGAPTRRPDQAFDEILRDGPAAGVHLIFWCDSVANLNRTIKRNSIREIEQRVLFQMSESDSSALIETPDAARLGIKRAIFYREEFGHIERFRPYTTPDAAWLRDAVDALRRQR